MSDVVPKPAERRFVSAALACSYAGEFGSLAEGFFGLPPRICEPLACTISNRLARHAALTGDWRVWAGAQWELRLPVLIEAAQPFRERLDTIGRGTRHDWAPDPRRRKLACAALRTLRSGASGRELLAQLHFVNRALPDPLPSSEISAIALWAARTLREGGHAVR